MKKEPKNQNSDQGNFSIKGGQVFIVNEAEDCTENFNERIGENEEMNEEEQRLCEEIHPILPIISEIDNLQKMVSSTYNYIQEQEDIKKSEKHQPEDKDKSEETKQTKNEMQYQQEGRSNDDDHANFSQLEDQLKDDSNSKKSDKPNQYIDAGNQYQSTWNSFSGITIGRKTKQNNSINHTSKDKNSSMRDQAEVRLEMEQKQKTKNRTKKTKRICKTNQSPKKNPKPKKNDYHNSIQFQINQIFKRLIIKNCYNYHHKPCEEQQEMNKFVYQKFPHIKAYFQNPKQRFSFAKLMEILEWDLSLPLKDQLEHNSEQTRMLDNQQLWKRIFNIVQIYHIINNANFKDETIDQIRQKKHRQWQIVMRLRQLKLYKKPKPTSLYWLLNPQGKKMKLQTQTHQFQSESKLVGYSMHSPNLLGNQEDFPNNKSEQQKIVTENPNANDIVEAENSMNVAQEDDSMAEQQTSNMKELDEISKSFQELIWQTPNRQVRICSLLF